MFKNLLFKKNRIDFIVIGVQKAGTTALDFYLRNHSEIEMGKVKEIHFFDKDAHFERKKIDYKEYHQNFNFLKSNKIFGEATPIYIWWKDSIKRIFEYNKNIKLIVILRNPIHRAFSHWNMEISRNNENRDFYSCIAENKFEEPQNRITSYKQRGFYGEQIENVLKYFPKEQLLFIKYEDFLGEQESQLKKVFRFLNVSTKTFNYDFKESHNIKYNSGIDQESKTYLLNAYLKDIAKVEKMLGWDCNDWKV